MGAVIFSPVRNHRIYGESWEAAIQKEIPESVVIFCDLLFSSPCTLPIAGVLQDAKVWEKIEKCDNGINLCMSTEPLSVSGRLPA